MKPGERVDRYVVESELGRGGMGEVYEALDTRLARKVALKILPPGADAMATQRMVREARAAAAFQHPNAVVVYDVGECADATYIAMELVRGKTLRRFVGAADVPIGRRIRWLVDVARALAAAHDAGLVHRDVKPDNVMIRDDGAVKVLDFGIARRPAAEVDPSAPTEENAIPTLTERGMIVGTPQYASPEQLRGEALDGRSDQFSWGVLAYELFTGKPPWRGGGEALALLSQVLSAEVPALAAEAKDVPPEVAAAVHRALSKSAADRFADMRDLADVLEPFADAAATTGRATLPATAAKTAASPVAPTPAARIARRTGRYLFYGLAAFGALVVVGLVVAGSLGHVHVDMAVEKAAASAAAAAGSTTEIASLACREAVVTGDGATPLMKRAIGIGACARLATELDVDWLLEGGQAPLEVTAELGQGTAKVTLAAQGQKASAEGKAPVDAVAAATAELAKRLRPAPMTPEQIKAWGATDADGARRIERVWRQMIMNLTPNHVAAIQAVTKSDPGSPWPYACAAMTLGNGTPEQEAARKKALELAKSLPSSRAAGLRGTMLYITGDAGRAEGLEDLRRSYREAPDDAEIAGLFAAVAIGSRLDEAWAVLDRLYARFPTRSVLALENAISSPGDRDFERDEKYLGKLHDTLPETVAWYMSVRHLALRGRLGEAREALAFADRFGLSGKAADAAELSETRILVELIADDPKAVREIAGSILGDPRPAVASYGARAMMWSYFLEGRFDDALDAQRRNIDRTRSSAGPHELAREILNYAMVLRRLGRRPIDAALADEAEKAARESKIFRATERAAITALLAYARADRDPKKAKAALSEPLAELERLAEAAPDRSTRESARLNGLLLARVVRGDAEAARVWRETTHANHWSREGAALDAGLSLEAAGAKDEAEKAYLEAASPDNATTPLVRMIAHLRLAELYRATARPERAAEHDATIQRVWHDVDPALLERFKKL